MNDLEIFGLYLVIAVPYQFGDGEGLGLDERLCLGDVGTEQRLELLGVHFGQEILQDWEISTVQVVLDISRL